MAQPRLPSMHIRVCKAQNEGSVMDSQAYSTPHIQFHIDSISGLSLKTQHGWHSLETQDVPFNMDGPECTAQHIRPGLYGLIWAAKHGGPSMNGPAQIALPSQPSMDGPEWSAQLFAKLFVKSVQTFQTILMRWFSV